MTQIKQGLELKQTQRLSPLQMQTIRLIELPVQELEQRIKSEFEDNPVLDDDAPTRESDDNEPKDVSIDEIDENDPTPAYRLHVNNYGKDERPQYNTFSVKESFTQSLMRQLGFRDLDKHQREVAAFIIGSLDEDGYLRRDLDSLVDDLAFRPVSGPGTCANACCYSSAVKNRPRMSAWRNASWKTISRNSPTGISRKSSPAPAFPKTS